MGKVTVQANLCERCGHVWVPNGPRGNPRVCPKCKSPWWNRERTRGHRRQKDAQ
jgi:predicted Zn-ribbon and HTH transcriptional regulator